MAAGRFLSIYRSFATGKRTRWDCFAVRNNRFYFLARRELPIKRLCSTCCGNSTAIAVQAGYGPVFTVRWALSINSCSHHFARFVSNKYRHPQPFYFYVPIVAALVLPWTMVLIATLTASPRWRWRGIDTIDCTRVFALAWLAVPTLFFSLSGSKIPGYVLPVLPAASFWSLNESGSC